MAASTKRSTSCYVNVVDTRLNGILSRAYKFLCYGCEGLIGVGGEDFYEGVRELRSHGWFIHFTKPSGDYKHVRPYCPNCSSTIFTVCWRVYSAEPTVINQGGRCWSATELSGPYIHSVLPFAIDCMPAMGRTLLIIDPITEQQYKGKMASYSFEYQLGIEWRGEMRIVIIP